jgi:hypothetical protein
VSLPLLVLVRVGVVADPANDKAREAIHQPRRLHLKAQYPTKLRADPIPLGSIPHRLVARRNRVVVYRHLRSALAFWSWLSRLGATLVARISALVVKGSLEQKVGPFPEPLEGRNALEC